MSRFFDLLAPSLDFLAKFVCVLLAGVGVNAGSTDSVESVFFVKAVVAINIQIILNPSCNCPDANIVSAGSLKNLRASIRRGASRKNVIHQNHAPAGQVCAGVNCKGAAHISRALLARQQCLGGRGFDAPEQISPPWDLGGGAQVCRKARGLIEFAPALFQRVQGNRRNEIPFSLT